MKNIFLSLLLVATFSANAMQTKYFNIMEEAFNGNGCVTYSPEKQSIEARININYGIGTLIERGARGTLIAKVWYDLNSKEHTSRITIVGCNDTIENPSNDRFVELLKKKIEEFESTMTKK